MVSKPRLLIVDDEPQIRRVLRAALPDYDFELMEADGGKEAVRMIATHNPEVVLLDLGLPDLDGVEVIREIRQWSQVPIIVLSARGEEQTKVRALDCGANDYVTKPFSMPELIARVRVALRQRVSTQTPQLFEEGEFQINFESREVTVRGAKVHLTPLEYKLLCLLARNVDRVLTHSQILSEVWGSAYSRQNHYLRILMKSLRQKVEVDPSRPKLLITESGIGYRLKL